MRTGGLLLLVLGLGGCNWDLPDLECDEAKGECPTHSGWVQVGAQNPVIDRTGQPGVILRPSFIDTEHPEIMTAVICPATALDSLTWLNCRPATSRNSGATFVLHDSSVFDVIEANDWGWQPPMAARSAADPERIYYAVNGHPWSTPAPKGGLWRSDDGGHTWTENLRQGEPGESGLIGRVVPDPMVRDRVYINRGYDYGNASVSNDAGATFSIICGHDNVNKTGDDIWCGSFASFAIDFPNQRLFYKHHFQSQGVVVALDASMGGVIDMPGLGSNESAFNAAHDVQVELPIAGLSLRPVGVASFRFTADAAAVLYLDSEEGSPDQRVWHATSNFSSGYELPEIVPAGGKLILTHPRHACTWIVQTGSHTLMKTSDCAVSWSPIDMTGFGAASPFIAAAYAPDCSDHLLVFTADGRRFRTRAP